MDPRDSSPRESLLRFGPGPKLDRAARLCEVLRVEALLAHRGEAPPPRISRWFDAAEFLAFGPRDRVVLDADHMPMEDIGLVRRFLASRPLASLECFGSDRSSSVGRALLSMPQARWHAWPLELGQLELLLKAPPREPASPVSPAGPDRPASPEPAPVARRTAPRASPAEPLPPGGKVPAAPPVSPPPEAPLDADVVPPQWNEWNGGSRGPAPIADLAPRAGAPETDPDLAGEIARVQLALRSAAPKTRSAAPVPGAPTAELETFDLESLVEEELAVLALHSRGVPRVRFHGGGPLPVRADREGLIQSLGALLDVARALSGSSETIEVLTLAVPTEPLGEEHDSFGPFGSPGEFSSTAGPASEGSPRPPSRPSGRPTVRVRVAAGLLLEGAPALWFQPGGLGTRLPGIDSSELHALARAAAARGIQLTGRRVAGPRSPASSGPDKHPASQAEFDLSLAPVSPLEPPTLRGVPGPLGTTGRGERPGRAARQDG